jgi:hypothetical protein
MSELLEKSIEVRKTNVDHANILVKENQKIKKIGTTEVNGVKVPIIKQGACGANIWQMSSSDINKVGKGKTDFLIVGVKDKKGKYYNYAFSSIESSKMGFEKALKNEKLEMLLSSGEFTLSKIIITNKVFDCQTFVNETLKSEGSRSLNAQPIEDVKKVTKSFKVPFMKFNMFFDDTKNTNSIKIDGFFNQANPGDVLLFVKKIPKKEVANTKKSDLIKIEGTYYTSLHVTLYTGKDVDNHPTIAQAHIYGGAITKQPFYHYSTKNRRRYDGVFIIPKSSFKRN